MSSWRFDTEKTRERYEALQRFYRGQGLNADQFSCKFYEQCSGSQKPGTVKQYSGGTAGLAPLYDVFYRDKPIRILIVGKESAYEPVLPFNTADNFDVRSKQVVDTISRRKRNNHIIGTLITLQKIFEAESDYLYACYALTNALRCAFQKKSDAHKRSKLTDTRTMRVNCSPYLRDEIRILEPTLIIIQGSWAIADRPTLVERLADGYGIPKQPKKNVKNGKYGLYEFADFMLITSPHPSILPDWKKNFAPDTLWPMIDYLKDSEYLPRITPEDATLLDQMIVEAAEFEI